MNIGSLIIVDPSEAPGFGYDALRTLLIERINGIPEFTMKLKEVPLGLDRPLLVADPSFDIDRHVHRTTVPAPGGRRELAGVVGDLISVRLDRWRPLWEAWVIEGLEGGQVAFLTKVHHGLADGVSGAALGAVLCDLEPNPRPRWQGRQTATGGRVPGDMELAVMGALSAAASPLRLAAWAVESSVRSIRRDRLGCRKGTDRPLSLARPMPWNGRLSTLRGYAFLSIPLEEVKAIRHRFDVTVNDVVLAVCAGALRRWLLDHGNLPSRPLTAAVPVSLRAAGDFQLGNKISSIFVSLSTHLPDPVDRLRSISASAGAAKDVDVEPVRGRQPRRLSDLVPPGLAGLGCRAFVAAGLDERIPLPSDVVISNVRGSSRPLYIAGGRIVGVYPVPPAVLSQGMDITIISYLDSVDFGFTVDRQKVPDPWELADHVPDALGELVAAAAWPASRAPYGAVRGAARPQASRPTPTTKPANGQSKEVDEA